MTDQVDKQQLCVEELNVLVAQGDLNAKKELARRLMKDETENNEKVVSLLEDCASLGDADAMLILAQCYALGPEREQNRKRIETLLAESSKNGNKEALSLVELMTNLEGQKIVDLSCLCRLRQHDFHLACLSYTLFHSDHDIGWWFSGESVGLAMNMLGWKSVDLSRLSMRNIKTAIVAAIHVWQIQKAG